MFVADGSTIPLRLLCASKMASSSLSLSPVVSGSTGVLVVSGFGASVTTEVGSDAIE